jgi:5-keto-L-gluconate epimerase
MRLATAITTPEVPIPVPVALLTGSFSERLDKARDLGYDGVELMVLDPARFDTDLVCRQIKERGLEAPAIGTGAQFLVDRLTLLAGDPAIEVRAFDRFRSLAAFAGQCGAPLVTIGSFRGKLAWGGPGARARLIATLRRCAEVAQSLGVRIALEPLNRYESDVVNNSAEGISLVHEVGHSALGLLLDTFHMNVEEPDIAGGFHLAAPSLWHVHLGDSNRLSPGEGHFDFAAAIRALRDLGYVGYLSAELLARPDPDTAAERTISAMRRLIPRSH